MASLENDDFGRIALAQGFCTREQVERCLRIQINTTESLSLGQSLLREACITPEKYSAVLTLLRKESRRKRPDSRR